MTGTHLCYHHGGKTPTGVALPQYKTGRYSKAAMQPQLRERAEELLADPEYLSLRENIAYHDASIINILESMERGEAGKLWEKLHTQRQMLEVARQSADVAGQTAALNSILALIDRGYKDYMARLELERHHLTRAKLVEAEGKRIERAQASVSAAQFVVIIHRLAEAVAKHVRDDKAVQAITAEFYALIGPGAEPV